MIRAFDTDTNQFLLMTDYLKSLTNDNYYGILRETTMIDFHPQGILITSTGHNLLAGQVIYITGSTDYDGEYSILTVVDADTFTVNAVFTTDQYAEVYPIMDSNYFIAFFTGIEDVFNRVKTLSAYQNRTKRPENNSVIIGEYAITEDHRDLFMMLLEQASNEISSPFQAYNKLVIDSYVFNKQFDFDYDGIIPTNELFYIANYISEDPSNQQWHEGNTLDNIILLCLASYVLREWHRLNGQMNEMAIENEIYAQHFRDMKSLLMKIEGNTLAPFRVV